MKGFILFFAFFAIISSAVINTSAPPSSEATATDPTQCVSQNCPTEYDACLNNAVCPSTMTSCVSKCSSNQSCLKTCAVDASLEPTFGIVNCAFKFNCFDVVEPAMCIQQNCPANYNACPSDPQCQPTLYKCYDQCKSNSDCWTQCIAGNRNPLAIHLTECAIAKQCLVVQPTTPIDCVQKQCPQQLSGCQQDSKCEPTLYACYDKCKEDKKCWDQCLAGASTSQPAMDVSNCGLTNGCFILQDPVSCIKEYCLTQYKACGKDPTCQPVAEKCFGQCLNDNECWKYCLQAGVVDHAVAVANCAFAKNCLSL